MKTWHELVHEAKARLAFEQAMFEVDLNTWLDRVDRELARTTVVMDMSHVEHRLFDRYVGDHR